MNTLVDLKKYINYIPETGVFYWIVGKGNSFPGKEINTKSSRGYLTVMINGKNYYLHRLAWFFANGCMPDGQIDHINCIKTDNRISNLRLVSAAVNMQNIKKALSSNKSTGLLGVTKLRDSEKYLSQIRIGGKKVRIGLFDSPEKAHAAYVEAKRKNHIGCTI